MKQTRFSMGGLAVASLIFCSGIASAAAPQAPNIQIWRQSEHEDLRRSIFVDYDQSVPGIELFGLTLNCSRSPRDGNNFTTTKVTSRLVVRSSQDGSLLFRTLTLPTVVSRPYPDPTYIEHECDGSNPTSYDRENQGSQYPRDSDNLNFQGSCGGGTFDPNDGDGASGICGVFPSDFLFGAGVANVGESRYVVYGDAVRGKWSNNSGGGDAGSYSVHVYSLDGNRVWTASFAGETADGSLEPAISGVGDFLGDGSDVLRVGRIRETGSGDIFWYRHYNLTTGAVISTRSFTVSTP